MLQVLLTLHILGAVVFVGNIITAAFWKARADRSGDLHAIAFTARSLVQADLSFTTPGIIVLLATGTAMVGITDWTRFQETWLSISFVLLIITAIIWFVGLLPLQKRMRRISQDSVTAGVLDPEYTRAGKQWAMFGGIATLLPIIILFLMVLKPGI